MNEKTVSVDTEITVFASDEQEAIMAAIERLSNDADHFSENMEVID